MKYWYRLLAIAFAFPVAVAAWAGSAPDRDDFLGRVQGAIDEGDLTVEEALLCKIQYLFDPAALSAQWQLDDPAPLKCGSAVVWEFQQSAGELEADLAAKIAGYLQPTAAQAVVSSPSGRFQLSYSLEGENAVPSADVDPANGRPDFVERIAGYLDQAWELEIVDAGFRVPPPTGESYPVSFQAMTAYGYTAVVDPDAGSTRIVLHNTFEGFPPNDDPEGNRWGAAKVTVAHELKHASQFAASRWNEAGWIELDAVWAEELVFDQVNDYYNFLTGESPLRRPDLSLDAGGSGSYEDVVFQLWLEQVWGVEIIRDFWNRRESEVRAAGGPEAVMESWCRVLADRGMSLDDSWAEFTAWNYGTDLRAKPNLGYEEAREYPCGEAEAVAVPAAVVRTGSVAHLAARNFRLYGFADVPETGDERRLELELRSSNPAAALSLAVYVTRRDGTGLVETCVMEPGRTLSHLVGVPWSEILGAGVVVGNAALDGPACPFELSMAPVEPGARAPLVFDASSVGVELSGAVHAVRELTITSTAGEGPVLDFAVEVCPYDPRAGVVANGPDPGHVDWLRCTPLNGRLEPGADAVLTLEFSAAGLGEGSSRCWLAVRAAGFGDPVAIPVTLSLERSGGAAVADGFSLGSHPNPFNPATWIHFQLPAGAIVQVDVLDLRGHVVCRLLDEWRDAGPQRVEWNGRNAAGAPLGAGLYLARLQTGGQPFTCKMILAK